MPTPVLWFRRDLRLGDNPAVVAAAAAGEVVGLFVADPALRRPAGDARLAFLSQCLGDLNDRMEGRLVVRSGPPERAVADVAREVDADAVHVAADYGVYGGRETAVSRPRWARCR